MIASWKCALLATAIGSAALISSGTLQAQPAGLDKDSIVQASLLADTTAVSPGTTFTLGVLFKAKPSWHIYWKHPGASGFATTVQWGLPPGSLQSETLYPVPVTFESPGPVISFGYEKETMLMVEAQAANLPEKGQVQITAKGKWLMCSDRCIPNSKELTLTLPVGDGKPANKEVFDKYRALLPEKATKFPDGVDAKAEVSGSSTTFTITMTAPEGKALVAEGHEKVHPAYFYPNPHEGYVTEPPTLTGKTKELGGIKVYDGPAVATYVTEPESNSASPARSISGTLVYQTVTGSTPDKPVLLEITGAGK